jgi:uncharacterized cupredoxin-like copper-binding protein
MMGLSAMMAIMPSAPQEKIMNFRRFAFAAATMLVSSVALIAPAFADATVNVSLWDKGGMMDMSKSMGMGMGMHGNMTMAMMGIKTDQMEVPAGNVTFKVINDSKETVHEMLVIPVADENAVLPFVEAENRVDEEASGDLGEVSELEPGKAGELTLELKPGTYMLMCNVPGHYMAGMWTMIKVK